jgi:glycosyltransferase involved in cell wall biosynthesis
MSTRNGVENSRVFVINPLGGALRHYTDALVSNLREAGATVTVKSIFEPSLTESGRISWLRAYVAAMRATRRAAPKEEVSTLIVTWPVLGYIDLILATMVLRRQVRVKLVMHDPKPLVAAVGYGAVIRRIAASLTSAQLIVHSDAALRDVSSQGFGNRTVRVPHPVSVAKASIRSHQHFRTVRVVGQFKPDRDLEALAHIAAAVGGDVNLEIHGRRWPDVDGWSVTEGFVPEEKLEELIRESAVIVVPYKRFYQSGVAIRSVELGTAVVGPGGTSLDELLGFGSPLLVATASPEAWGMAVAAALAMDHDDILNLAKSRQNEAVIGWKGLLAS